MPENGHTIPDQVDGQVANRDIYTAKICILKWVAK